MAEAEFRRDPIAVRVRSYGTERYQFGAASCVDLNFGTDDEPVLIRAPKGVSELVLQGRMCGDFYAEASGTGFCLSAVNDDAMDAVRAAFEQVSA